MDFKALKTFLTLSQTMSYQKAAELLNFAPSTLNRHIQLLEEELGAKLFAKRGRWLEMTQDGQAFVSYARRMIEVYKEAINNIGVQTERDEICICGCEIVLAHCMVDLLSAFTKADPQTSLTMLTSPNIRIPEMIRSGVADIGYYYTMDCEPLADIQETILFSEPLVLCAVPDHPLFEQDEVHYADLKRVDFAFPHTECCAAVEILRQLKMRAIPTGRTAYLGAMQITIEQVLSNQALLAVPLSAAEHFSRIWGLKTIHLNEKPLPMYARILYKDESKLSPAAHALLHYSIQHSKTLTEVC